MGTDGTGSDVLVRQLLEENVEVVFGIPGAHVLPLYDALGREGSIRVITARHEGGAAYMARLYARATGNAGVCIATAGPGATNLVTGVADAYTENVPLVVITGQVASPLIGRNAAQEASGEPGNPDQVGLFRHITKLSTQANRPDRAVDKLREAFRIALAEPMGPVHLSLPSDVQAAPAQGAAWPVESYRPRAYSLVDAAAVAEAATRLCAAKRPAIVVGRRAVVPWAGKEVAALQERFGLPVATTVGAKGMVDERRPLSLGTLHMFGHRVVDRYLYDADCIVTVGEAFEEYSTNYYEEELFPEGSLIQVDCAPFDFGRNYPMGLAVPGSIRATLRALAEELDKRGYRCPAGATEIEALKGAADHGTALECESMAFPLKPQRIYRLLTEMQREDLIIQTDMGQNFFWAIRYLLTRQGGVSCTWGFMPMGAGGGGAPGLALAHPGKRILAVCGDGAMQMHGMEVATAVEHSLDVTWLVFEDARLNMVHMAQGMSYGERYVGTEMHNPDFVQWAAAQGARSYRVRSAAELPSVLAEAAQGSGPAVVSIPVDGDELLPVKPRLVLLAKKMGLEMSDSRTAARAFRKVLDER